MNGFGFDQLLQVALHPFFDGVTHFIAEVDAVFRVMLILLREAEVHAVQEDALKFKVGCYGHAGIGTGRCRSVYDFIFGSKHTG